MDMAEFLQSAQFRKIRERKHGRQWSERALWLALALAALHHADSKLEAKVGVCRSRQDAREKACAQAKVDVTRPLANL
ncbi:MAG TPA: hypothetical protein VGN97_05670 [Mesorhizobium sp.]|nr:hypothetical protein [Mesorhizobium sp.]